MAALVVLIAAGWAVASAAAATAAEWMGVPVGSHVKGPKPGEMLDATNWEEARGLLPPEILRHFKKGEYANRVVEWPDGLIKWSEEWKKAVHDNTGRYTVDERGTIVDKRTGRQPAYIFGLPFPKVDPADPRAGVKILWNYFYRYWVNGNSRTLSVVNWIGRHGLDRQVETDTRFLYYDGQPREFLPPRNPNNLLVQFLAETVSPADLNGTTALSWRYRDADHRDANWSYVPALRRVRAVSPTNRSDGFLGSDLSQDDGPFFDGKPEDFTWRLVGQGEVLRFADPLSLRGEVGYRRLPGGGWRIKVSPRPYAGFLDPNWKGIAWAPVSMVLARRRAWIIEGVPKDRYYLYGKLQLFIDQECYEGLYNRKFSWKGELLNVMFAPRTLNFTPDGHHYLWSAPTGIELAENIRLDRATNAGPPPKGEEDPYNDYLIPLDPRDFEPAQLVRLGK